MLTLELALPPKDVSLALRNVLERFSARLQLPIGASPAELQNRIQSYLTENPLPDNLVTGFRQIYQEAFQLEDRTGLSQAFQRFADQNSALLSNEPPPPGAVRGGPLGFFEAKAKVAPQDKPKKRR